MTPAVSWGLREETEVQKLLKSFAMAFRPMTLRGLAAGGAAINLSGLGHPPRLVGGGRAGFCLVVILEDLFCRGFLRK